MHFRHFDNQCWYSFYIYNFSMLVEVSTITRMCMEFEFSMKDSTKIDIFGAQSDFSLHFALFLSLA